MSLLKVAGPTASSGTLYVDDVFSTYLYTGNGSTQTITNGIDLAGKGGMVWVKSRSAATDHKLTDTVRGATKALISDTTGVQTTDTTGLTAFSSTGFSLGASSVYNTNAATYASWTFRKAAKFFDVVTYTGDGTSNRSITHSLGVAPGMIIVKNYSSGVENWKVYHRSLPTTPDIGTLELNLTGAVSTANNYWGTAGPTSTAFVVNSSTNNNGATYVAYLFAHDTSSTGIIQCGSYTGNGSATGPVVTLGWEPQYLMVKKASGTGNWQVIDSMRGMPVGSADATLQPNLANAESSVEYLSPTATGFQITSTSTEVNTSGSTYIYMAIRRPNKPPTTGTQVFLPEAYLGNDIAPRTLYTGFTVDSAFTCTYQSSGGFITGNRLMGAGAYLQLAYSGAQLNTTSTYSGFDNNIGLYIGPGAPVNFSTYTYINYSFKRAPGFFDVVCYTGTGSATTQAHNLTAVPELMIVKERSAVNNWWVYVSSVGNTKYSVLNSTAIPVTGSTAWNNTTPTASVFSIGTGANVNASTQTYVAYLFATLAGISKVGSYTGNGTSQNIECGFAAGARLFLVKATSTTGSWWVWDSERGIIAGNDPALQLNSSAAQITTADAVDPYSPGITVNQEATCSINASGVSYIFLAVA